VKHNKATPEYFFDYAEAAAALTIIIRLELGLEISYPTF
jgi:hypothetical protein